MVVLTVSMGISAILKRPAATDAAIVFAKTGISTVISNASNAAMVPVLAAVSPNRDNGPCTNAGIRPL